MEKHPLQSDPLPAEEGGDGQRSPARSDTKFAPTPPPDEVNDPWSGLGATRVIADPLGDAAPSEAPSDDGPISEVRRKSEGKKLVKLGDYHISRKLGEGAMGAVYKAYHAETSQKVALKVLFRHVAGTPKLVERFYREALVAGRLDHPNIIRGYEVGEAGGLHFFAMEYVSGFSLQKLVAKLGKLSVGDALYVTLRAAAGLQYVHEQGFVHRDVKPDNILVTRTGEIKVGDLGMVKLGDEEMSLTQTGHAVGTPWYMPMEQAKNSKDIDGRSDIYALGCVLYALLTGRPPFSGPTLVDVIQLKEIGTFPPARQFNHDVPERLDLIVAKMAAKHARHRYQSCDEVIRDLESLELANATLTFLAPAAGEGPSPSDRTPLPPEAATQERADTWHVRYRNADGYPVARKMTTAEVLELIEDEGFDPATKASREPKEGYRALATYREFASDVLGRVTKQGADRQTARYRERYQQIEAEDENRRQKRKAVQTDRDARAAYRRHLAIRIAVGTGAALGGLFVLWLLYRIVRGLFF